MRTAVIVKKRKYILIDMFSIARSVGSIDATPFDGTGGSRVVVDTENKISTVDKLLYFSGGKATPAFGDPRIEFGTFSRKRGRLFVFVGGMQSGAFMLGTGVTSTANKEGIEISGTTLYSQYGNGASITAVGTYTLFSFVPFVINQHDTGFDLYMRSGGKWLLMYSELGTTGNNKLMVANNNAVFMNYSVVEVPNYLWLSIPIASDSFATAFGTTNGLGHASSSGFGAGGSGLTWTQQAGTWGISTAKAVATALAGGLAIATVPCGTKDVLIRTKLTRSAGVGGGVARYTDANNHIRFYHDGTNVKMDEVVAGTPTTRITGTATYVATAVVELILDTNTARLYYNNAFIGTYASIDAALTATAHGLYTTDTSNLLDDFVVRPRGTGNEHIALDRFVLPDGGVFNIGDSKTNGHLWVNYLNAKLNGRNRVRIWNEITPRYGQSGYTAAQMNTYVAANLASVTGTAQFCTINLGANDVAALPAQATWKADMIAIIDAVRAKWPGIIIYIARAWRRSYTTECNTLATWISDIVALYPDGNVRLGQDERIWMENGDDGVTYTSDGIHYNAAGEPVCAEQWITSMGY